MNVPIAEIIGMIKEATIHTAATIKAGAAKHTAAMVKAGDAKHTAAETMEDVITTAAIVDTGLALTGKDVTTPITTIEDTGMSTMAIGDPGTNGIDTPKPIRTFTGTETTIAKVPI